MQGIRVNGRGNAWPVFVGKTHPFYKRKSEDLSNASYSLISFKGNDINYNNIRWEVLIDAGHHTVPYIIQNENRIPEAIFITHAHLDHTLGIDWIAQSYHYTVNKEKPYPVYCTKQVFQIILSSYPHLLKIIEHKELIPGITTQVDEVDQLRVTAYPVYHGISGVGASMLLFDIHENNAVKSSLFTGDLICPLLRESDYDKIAGAACIYIDTNNRYPYPESNHGSFTSLSPDGEKSEHLVNWLNRIDFSDLLSPHKDLDTDKLIHPYFYELLEEKLHPSDMICSVCDFIVKTRIKNVNLVHYGGMEDKAFYNEEILTEKKLETWAGKILKQQGLNNTEVHVSKTGDFNKL